MFKRNNQILIACCILVLIIGAVPAKASAVVNSSVSSKDSFLHPDGTLKLDGSLSGPINLQEWDVQMDPIRGPVFNSKKENINISALVNTAPGQWNGLGSSGAMNAPVTGIVVSGTDVYVSGDFTNAGGIPEADYVARWDGTKWSALGSNGVGDGAIPGHIYAIAISGTNVYIGGDFESINNDGNIINYGAVAKWNGTDWSAVGNLTIGNFGLNGHVVRTMVVSGASLYVGGMFYNLYSNGVVIANGIGLIKWNGTNWSTVGGNSAVNSINAMAIVGSDIYVGGDFINAAGIPQADFIAKWNGTNWSALGSNGAGDGALDKNVYEITANATDIYVGGLFSNAGGVPEADVIAKWNGTNWSAVGSNGAGDGVFDPSHMYVYSILVDGSSIYIGGAIWHPNNKGIILNTVTSIAKWDGSNWSGLGSDGAGGSSLNDIVYVIAMADGKLYVGGAFGKMNNNGVLLSEANYFAKWDGMNWSAVGKGDGSINDQGVHAVAVVGTDVYVGGCFENVNNKSYFDFLVKWDGMNWSNLRATELIPPPIKNCVYALATDGTNLYVGGAFQNADDIPSADYIAKWDGTNWSALGSNGAGDGSLNTQAVFAIATTGTNVYVGGSFTNVNNSGAILTAADYIAKWNGANWSALGSNGSGDGSIRTTDPGDSAQVSAIAVSGSDVYVGGWFQNVRNGLTTLGTADCIAKWNGLNWSALGSNGSGNGALSDFVGAIAVKGNEVYVGGEFTEAGGIPQADYIAKWNGLNWSALGNDGIGNGVLKPLSPYFSVINSIVIDDSNIFVGGLFADINNYGSVLGAADYIAKWDGANWSALGSNGANNGSLQGQVYSIAVNGSNVYAGGDFINVNNNGTVLYSADFIAVYGNQSATQISIGGANMGSYFLAPHESQRQSYEDVNNGPVKIINTDDVSIIAAERVIYKVNNIPTSFSEMMALPDSQLDTTYWMPWYNNVDLDTQLRFGNVSNTPAEVHVWIGGQEKTTGCTTTPANVPYPYVLAVGASLRVSCPGINDGPVKIISNVNIVAAERVIYNVNGLPTSFTEMMGLPDSQLNTTYWMPWYNNVDLDTQLRFGNVSNTPAEVHVWIGGQEKTSGCTTIPANIPYPYVLAVGASLRVSCPTVNSGPVRIISNVNIVAAERVIYNVNGLPTSFTEMMGLPDSQLNTTYWMPWYNNVDLDTQLRFGNVSNTPAEVHVWIGGQEKTSGCTTTPANVPYPYVLDVGASLRVSCPTVNSGPVRIISNVNIVAAERVIYKINNLPTSFTEMMGLPDSQLDTTYWMPWYNNIDLDSQLRFGVP